MNKISAAPAQKPKSREVIYPSFFNQLILLGISAVFVFGVFWTIESSERPILGFFGIVFFGVGALMLMYSLIARRPQIILDEQSLTYKNIFNTKSWKWNELGPFELDKLITGKGFIKSTQHSLCAFSREQAEFFAAKNDTTKPNTFTSDAAFPLNAHKLKERERVDLRDKINHYREKAIHGVPFDEILSTDDGYSNFIEKFEKKHRMMGIAYFFTFIFLVLLFTADLIFPL
jgi:hypothetical protein